LTPKVKENAAVRFGADATKRFDWLSVCPGGCYRAQGKVHAEGFLEVNGELGAKSASAKMAAAVG
jgi:hypothetical protein